MLSSRTDAAGYETDVSWWPLVGLYLINIVRARPWQGGAGKLGRSGAVATLVHLGSSLRKIGVVISGLRCHSFVGVLCSVAGDEDAAG